MAPHVDYEKAGIKTCLELGLADPCVNCSDKEKRKAVCMRRKSRRHEFFGYCLPEGNELGKTCQFSGIDVDYAKNPDGMKMVECSNTQCQLNTTPGKSWFHCRCLGDLYSPNDPWVCPVCAQTAAPPPAPTPAPAGPPARAPGTFHCKTCKGTKLHSASKCQGPCPGGRITPEDDAHVEDANARDAPNGGTARRERSPRRGTC